MTSKIYIFLIVALVVVVGIHGAPSLNNRDIERPDVLYIQNPDSFPVILSPADLPSVAHQERNNLVCTAAMCRNVCNALGFIFGRCNVNRVCVCSNF